MPSLRVSLRLLLSADLTWPLASPGDPWQARGTGDGAAGVPLSDLHRPHPGWLFRLKCEASVVVWGLSLRSPPSA